MTMEKPVGLVMYKYNQSLGGIKDNSHVPSVGHCMADDTTQLKWGLGMKVWREGDELSFK